MGKLNVLTRPPEQDKPRPDQKHDTPDYADLPRPELDAPPPVDTAIHAIMAEADAAEARAVIARTAESAADQTQPASPATEGETWLQQQYADLDAWKNQQRQSGAEWAAQPDLNLPETLQAATAGDPEAIKAAVEYSRQADPAELLQPEFDALWEDDSFRYAIYSKIADMRVESVRQGVKFDSHQRNLVTRAFDRFGFSEQEWPEITKGWMSYRIEKHTPNYATTSEIDERKVDRLKKIMFQNFQAMELIERAEPGAVKSLYEDSGIRNFERYHEGELLEQVRNPKQATDMLTLSSAADWLGASSGGKIYALIRRFTRFPKGRPSQFVEAASPDEVRSRLADNVAKTGRPIKKLLMVMHSDGMMGDLGDALLTLDDIYGRNGKEPIISEGVLAPGAEIILHGCKAGAKDGLAQALAGATGARVVASPESMKGLASKRFRGAVFTRDTLGGEEVKTVAYGPSRAKSAAKRLLGRFTRRPKSPEPENPGS